MIENFITDSDLRTFYPKLHNQLWSSQTDFVPQISKAYDRLLQDLTNKGVDVRRVNPYLDLKRTGTPNSGFLTVTTETSPVTGSMFEAFGNPRRFVVATQFHSGSSVVTLQGSWNSTDWQPVPDAQITIGDSDADGAQSVKFFQQFKYYRYVSDPSASGIRYSVYLSESVFDDAICYGTFVLLYRDFVQEVGDIWDVRREQAEADYKRSLDSIRVLFDTNANQYADSGDTVERPGRVTFVM